MATPQVTPTAEPLTGDLVIDLATTGYRWLLDGTRTIDWSISGGFAGEFWTDAPSTQDAVELALGMVSYYANVQFNYVGSFTSPALAAAAGSEINVGLDGANRYFTSTSQWALGFFPSSQSNTLYPGAAGDIYLNINSAANSLPSYEPGSKGWALLLHEIGHTLGLKHPHDGGGTGRPTFEQWNLSDFDKDWLSVMSYSDDYNWNQLSWSPASFMVLDVLALQHLYGANPTTNAGDSLFNLSVSNAYLTLWDASGKDTLSFAGATKGFDIELPYFSASNLVPTRIGLAAPVDEMALDAPHTLFWLLGEYENVTGSAFADDIFGNDLQNVILAGGGDDYVDGDAGEDFLRGEAGDDSMFGGDGFDDMHGNIGNDTVVGEGGSDWVVGGQGNDLLIGGDDASDDVVYGNLGNDTQSAGDGNDWIRGGQGHDSLSAGGGNDLIWGDRGDDTISGGAGADIFSIFGEAGSDRITDFNAAEGDRLRVEAGYTYTVAQVGADVVVSVSGGAQAVLVGANLTALGAGWII